MQLPIRILKMEILLEVFSTYLDIEIKQFIENFYY